MACDQHCCDLIYRSTKNHQQDFGLLYGKKLATQILNWDLDLDVLANMTRTKYVALQLLARAPKIGFPDITVVSAE